MFKVSEARSADKVWLHLSNRASGLAPPVSIELQPTMACNLRCKWCSYWERNRFDVGDRQSLSLKVIEDVADYAARFGVRGVYLSGGGEPLTYRHIGEAVDLMCGAGVSLALITNGVLIERFILDRAHLFSYIQISIIGSRPEMHAINTAREGGFNAMIRAPRAILERHGVESPIVGAAHVVSDFNFMDVPDVLFVAERAGFDYCWFREAVDFETRSVSLSNPSRNWIRARVAELPSQSPDFTNISDLARPAPSRILNDCCDTTQRGLMATVAPDGNVFLCIPDVGAEGYAIGNLNETSFGEIWGGSRHQEMITRLNSRYKGGSCHTACRGHGYNSSIRQGPGSLSSSVHAAFI